MVPKDEEDDDYGPVSEWNWIVQVTIFKDELVSSYVVAGNRHGQLTPEKEKATRFPEVLAKQIAEEWALPCPCTYKDCQFKHGAQTAILYVGITH